MGAPAGAGPRLPSVAQHRPGDDDRDAVRLLRSGLAALGAVGPAGRSARGRLAGVPAPAAAGDRGPGAALAAIEASARPGGVPRPLPEPHRDARRQPRDRRQLARVRAHAGRGARSRRRARRDAAAGATISTSASWRGPGSTSASTRRCPTIWSASACCSPSSAWSRRSTSPAPGSPRRACRRRRARCATCSARRPSSSSTSIAGLGASIVYSWREKSQLYRVGRRLERLCTALDQRLVPVTPESARACSSSSELKASGRAAAAPRPQPARHDPRDHRGAARGRADRRHAAAARGLRRRRGASRRSRCAARRAARAVTPQTAPGRRA